MKTRTRVKSKGVHTEIVSLSVWSRAVPDRTSGDGARNGAGIFLEQIEECHEVAQFCVLGLEGCRRILYEAWSASLYIDRSSKLRKRPLPELHANPLGSLAHCKLLPDGGVRPCLCENRLPLRLAP